MDAEDRKRFPGPRLLLAPPAVAGRELAGRRGSRRELTRLGGAATLSVLTVLGTMDGLSIARLFVGLNAPLDLEGGGDLLLEAIDAALGDQPHEPEQQKTRQEPRERDGHDQQEHDDLVGEAPHQLDLPLALGLHEDAGRRATADHDRRPLGLDLGRRNGLLKELLELYLVGRSLGLHEHGLPNRARAAVPLHQDLAARDAWAPRALYVFGVKYLTACVQLHTTEDIPASLDAAEAEIRHAAAMGAKLVCTPENTNYLGSQFHKVELAESLEGPSATRLRKLADELSIHLLVGGLAEQRKEADGTLDPHRCYNTSVLYGDNGDELAVYRKMHLFDVDVPGGLTIKESDSIAAGDDVVVAETPLGRIGMTICYDVRFPELYRALVDRGADIIAVPSAFTLTTGKDHWHALLRARAIETQCWVLAAAQWGTHDAAGKRKSYGHSLIVDPWGCVVADKGQGVGLALAEVDLDRVAAVRKSVPVRLHRRL